MPAIPLPTCDDSSAPELSIVVMFTHDPELARACLESIAASTDELPASETILVLNAVSPDVRNLIESGTTGARIIESPVNTGTAVAWQLGFTAARGSHVLLMHEDAELRPGVAAGLLSTLRSEPDAAVVGPWLEEFGEHRRDINAGWLRFSDGGLRLTADQVPKALATTPYAVHEVSSAISLWRREAWEAIGGFEERTFPAISVEADSFAGIWARGNSVLVDPRLRGRHRTGAMNSAPTLLSGPHIRHFLGSRFERLWAEKWAPVLGWIGPPEPAETALARLQQQRVELPTIEDPPQSQQPITNPEGRSPAPTAIDQAIKERLVAAERAVIDEYTRWLIDRDTEMTARYEEAMAAYREESEKSAALRAELAGRGRWRSALRRLWSKQPAR